MDNGFLSNLVLALGTGLITVAFILMGFMWKSLHARISRVSAPLGDFVKQPELNDMKGTVKEVKTSMDSLAHDLRKHMQVEQYLYFGMILMTGCGFVTVIGLILWMVK